MKIWKSISMNRTKRKTKKCKRHVTCVIIIMGIIKINYYQLELQSPRSEASATCVFSLSLNISRRVCFFCCTESWHNEHVNFLFISHSNSVYLSPSFLPIYDVITEWFTDTTVWLMVDANRVWAERCRTSAFICDQHLCRSASGQIIIPSAARTL